MRFTLLCTLLTTGLAAWSQGQTGCPRVYPASVHLYLPVSLPPGPYPYVEDTAAVWIECDSAPPGGVPITIQVTGSPLVDVPWALQNAYRPADTTWENLQVRALSRAITPAPGTQQASIQITAAGQTIILPVDVTTTDAVFVKSELASLYMGFLSPALIDIDYTWIWFPNAQSTLPFSITTDSPEWLSTNPSSGYGYTKITPMPELSALPPGESLGTVIVSAPGAVNSPLRIPLRLLRLTGGIGSTPAELKFTGFIGEAAPLPQTLEISNLGSGSVPFQVSSDAAWLSVSPSNGATPGRITAAADITGLQTGTYRAHVMVFSPGSASLSVSVVLTVTAPNFLTVTPNELSFFTWPGRTVLSSEEGHLIVTSSRPLSFSVDSPAWLYHSPSAVTPTNLLVVPRWELLNPGGPVPTGTFGGTMTLSSTEATGSPLHVSVTAYSLAAAPLNASPDQIYFNGTAPPPQTIRVTAPAPTAFQVSVAAGDQWLAVSPPSGVTPATLTFSVTNPSLLATGRMSTVILYVAQSNGAPIPVNVRVFF